jgi:hypothetical protein
VYFIGTVLYCTLWPLSHFQQHSPIIYLSIHPSIIFPSIYQSIHPHVLLSIDQSIYSIHLSAHLSDSLITSLYPSSHHIDLL